MAGNRHRFSGFSQFFAPSVALVVFPGKEALKNPCMEPGCVDQKASAEGNFSMFIASFLPLIVFAVSFLSCIRFVLDVLRFFSFAWKGKCRSEKYYFLRWSEVFCMHLHRDQGSNVVLELRVC